MIMHAHANKHTKYIDIQGNIKYKPKNPPTDVGHFYPTPVEMAANSWRLPGTSFDVDRGTKTVLINGTRT